MSYLNRSPVFAGMILLAAASQAACAAEPVAASKIPVIVDTDIGTELDGALGLTAALASPEFEILGITTAGANAMDRAWMACHLLTAAGRKEIPVAAGGETQPDYELDWQIQYRRHPAVVWNRTNKPAKQSAKEFLVEKLKAAESPITIIATGPLTNVARVLQVDTKLVPKIRQVVCTESGLTRDITAASKVFASGLPGIIVTETVGTIASVGAVPIAPDDLKKLFAVHNRFSMQIEALYQMAPEPPPRLGALLAVAAAAGQPFVAVEKRARDPHSAYFFGGLNIAWAKQPSEVVAWYQSRIASFGPPMLPEPPGNRAKLIPAGGLPVRVHAWEDYDTDIEKRWWMAGKLETRDTPPESSRSCRSILTQDFDDLQGNTKTMYAGVVFNPVPGPPMGPRTRLAFRYKLHGADTLRIQLYSLSKGYHRYLSLAGLPQDRWENGAVDMTEMRRPDGSGGPLAADERIDDIQFYVDPRAEVLIDQMVLYEAAPDDEPRPFPRRILYTGVFDTGKQGIEWPGTFEITPHTAPRTWKHARSVLNPDGSGAWIRLDMRGNRTVGKETSLRFRYCLDGADKITLRLGHRGENRWKEQSLSAAKPGDWGEALVLMDTSMWTGDERAVNELQFRVPAGAMLSIDDVLLYEPH